jgi:hypothetical protein
VHWNGKRVYHGDVRRLARRLLEGEEEPCSGIARANSARAASLPRRSGSSPVSRAWITACDDEALAICWSSLGVMMILLVLTVLGGRAADLEGRPDEPMEPAGPGAGTPVRRLGKVTARRTAGSAVKPKGARDV